MSRHYWKAEAEALLTHARGVRAAATDGRATAAWDGAPLPGGPFPSAACRDLRAAMGYLTDELRLVAAGRAGTLAVLDDEIAHTEAVLGSL